MKVATGITLGTEVCDLLGLNPDLVAEITISFRPDELVYVEVHMMSNEGTQEFLGNLLKRYVLVEQVSLDDERIANGEFVDTEVIT